MKKKKKKEKKKEKKRKKEKKKKKMDIVAWVKCLCGGGLLGWVVTRGRPGGLSTFNQDSKMPKISREREREKIEKEGNEEREREFRKKEREEEEEEEKNPIDPRTLETLQERTGGKKIKRTFLI